MLMKEKNGILPMAALGLGLVVVVLVITLVYRGKKAADLIAADEATIAYHSNQWASVSAKLEEQQQVNLALTNQISETRTLVTNLNAQLADITSSLNDTRTALTNAQNEVVERNQNIAGLNDENAKLEARIKSLEDESNELNGVITSLNSKIADVSQQLATTKGDKAALEKELQRLNAEKADLERKFNDIQILKEQVSKLRRELNIARRLQRIQEGLPASSELKGGQKMMAKPVNPEDARHYDLNVEVNSDGSVKIIPPLNPADTNAPATTNSPGQ